MDLPDWDGDGTRDDRSHGAESRRRRRLAELTALCRTGSVARAVDLAFEHVAEFGRADEVVALLADAVAREGVPPRVRDRFAELVERSTG